jgi:sulfite reductase beta subunit-like hemoprotein
MHENYTTLTDGFADYVAERLTADELKPIAAPFGIYHQRDGKFMLRVRVNGGEIDCASLSAFADLLERAGGQAHLTSRQDIQLHNIPADRVMEAVLECDRLGWPFKGGGGNTYRNIMVSSESGLAPDSCFDVYPYAEALNRALRNFDKAFTLPRKFKIGFYACEKDLLKAAVQDLGFVATLRDGERGFQVYAGGGLGRDSAAGICLIEFMPVERLVEATFAMVSLFHDHGDRTNRNHARLRFLLKRIGAEAFRKLYADYYATTEDAQPFAVQMRSLSIDGLHDRFLPPPAGVQGSADYARWSALAVSPTRFGEWVKSVRLFVPYGNLTASALRAIAKLALDVGSTRVRLLTAQDVLIPVVASSSLAWLYHHLCQRLPEVDLTFRSFKGHIVTCVGATVCKIGMVDAPAVANKLAETLDGLMPDDPHKRQALQRWVADEVRISGCPNACSAHPVAQLGIGCINHKVDSAIVPHAHVFTGAGVTQGRPHLSKDTTGVPSPIDIALEQAKAHILARM